MRHEELTREIIGACFEVANELGDGFLESVYEKALMVALAERGLCAKTQVPLQVHFRDRLVGEFCADIVVEDAVIVELKAAATLTPQHKAQLINYLNATGLDIGLLVNFGRPKVEFARCWREHRPDLNG